MRPILEIYETLDQYQKGLLSDEEKRRVDDLCASDTAWMQAKLELELANEAILFHDMADLRMQMGKDLTQIPLKSPKNGTWLLGGSIGFLLIIGIVWFWLGNETQMPNPNPKAQRSENAPKALLPVKEKKVLEQQRASTKSEVPAQVKTISTEPAPSTLVESQVQAEQPTNDLVNEKQTEKDAKAPTIERSQPKVLTSVPCPTGFSDKITYSTKPACVEKQNGQVAFQMHGSNIEIVDIHGNKATAFGNLSAGNHIFIAEWSQGCKEELQVHVASKSCSTPHSICNPSAGEKCIIPLENTGKYHVTIHNRSGLKVWENQGQNQELTWDGVTLTGTLASPDMYVYSLIYEDGTSVHGQISVVK